uniref:Transmembrane protein n=1 Tax=Caenorhabditis tropicalis TaxID=1561998 RepID=A0A1I7TWH0_9PELO
MEADQVRLNFAVRATTSFALLLTTFILFSFICKDLVEQKEFKCAPQKEFFADLTEVMGNQSLQHAAIVCAMSSNLLVFILARVAPLEDNAVKPFGTVLFFSHLAHMALLVPMIWRMNILLKMASNLTDPQFPLEKWFTTNFLRLTISWSCAFLSYILHFFQDKEFTEEEERAHERMHRAYLRN